VGNSVALYLLLYIILITLVSGVTEFTVWVPCTLEMDSRSYTSCLGSAEACKGYNHPYQGGTGNQPLSFIEFHGLHDDLSTLLSLAN
jgi:hypothetical protein